MENEGKRQSGPAGPPVYSIPDIRHALAPSEPPSVCQEAPTEPAAESAFYCYKQAATPWLVRRFLSTSCLIIAFLSSFPLATLFLDTLDISNRYRNLFQVGRAFVFDEIVLDTYFFRCFKGGRDVDLAGAKCYVVGGWRAA